MRSARMTSHKTRRSPLPQGRSSSSSLCSQLISVKIYTTTNLITTYIPHHYTSCMSSILNYEQRNVATIIAKLCAMRLVAGIYKTLSMLVFRAGERLSTHLEMVRQCIKVSLYLISFLSSFFVPLSSLLLSLSLLFPLSSFSSFLSQQTLKAERRIARGDLPIGIRVFFKYLSVASLNLAKHI